MVRDPPAAAGNKSTNVRVEGGAPAADPAARTLVVALVAWAGAVALGAADGVFVRLGARLDIALGAFLCVFAIGVYALDASVRTSIDRAALGRIAAVAATGDAALAMALLAYEGDALFAGASAGAMLWAAPLALAAHVPLARAIAGRGVRRAAARPPAARRAAT